MVQLNYYYQTDLYQVSAALTSKLNFIHFDSQSIYGTGLILQLSNRLQPINKNILLEVNLLSIDDVLVVKNFEDLLIIINNSLATQSLNKFGKTNKFGDKYIKPYMINHSYKALKIYNDDVCIIYNKEIINTVKIYA